MDAVLVNRFEEAVEKFAVATERLEQSVKKLEKYSGEVVECAH